MGLYICLGSCKCWNFSLLKTETCKTNKKMHQIEFLSPSILTMHLDLQLCVKNTKQLNSFLVHNSINSMNNIFFFTATSYVECSFNFVCLSLHFLADSLQVRCGVFPVQYPGQLLLVTGGGDVPADTPRTYLRLSKEILLVVHTNRLGQVSL